MLNEYDEILSRNPDLLPGTKPKPEDRNEYDDLLDEANQAKAQSYGRSVYTATQTNPDEQAKAQKLSIATGIPSQVVARNMAEVEQQKTRAELAYEQVAAFNPEVAKFLTDAKNAQISIDDVPNLKESERRYKVTMQAFEDYGKMKAAQSRAQGMTFTDRLLTAGGIGAVSTMQALQKSPEFLAGVVAAPYNLLAENLRKNLPMPEGLSELEQKQIEEYKKNLVPSIEAPRTDTAFLSDVLNTNLATIPELNESVVDAIKSGDLGRAGELISYKMMQQVPLLATMFAGGAAAGPAVGGLVSGTETFEQAREKGMEPGQAALLGGTFGAVETAAEKLCTFGLIPDGWLDLLVKTHGKATANQIVRDAGIRLLKDSGIEAAKEDVTEFGQAVADFSIGQNKEAFKGIIGRMAEAGLLGGVMGAVLTGPGGAALALNQFDQLREQRIATDFYTALGETAAESKTRQRLPEAHRKYVEQLTKDGPLENIYVTPEAIEQHFQNPIEIMADMGLGKEYSDSLENGTALKIPLAKWVEKIAGTPEYDALANDIKFSENGITANQRKELQDAIKKDVESLQTAQAQAQTEAGIVGEDVQAQLETKVGYAPENAAKVAEIYSRFFEVAGKKYGRNPLELFQTYGLKFDRQAFEDFQKGKQKGQKTLKQRERMEFEGDEGTGLSLARGELNIDARETMEEYERRREAYTAEVKARLTSGALEQAKQIDDAIEAAQVRAATATESATTDPAAAQAAKQSREKNSYWVTVTDESGRPQTIRIDRRRYEPGQNYQGVERRTRGTAGEPGVGEVETGRGEAGDGRGTGEAGQRLYQSPLEKQVLVSLSAATGKIPGLDRLQKESETDPQAAALLRDVAADALEYLIGGNEGVKIAWTPATGLYGGGFEPSLGLVVTFPESARTAVLAGLEKFAQNFSQEQVHVRAGVPAGTEAGTVFEDGSYATPAYRFYPREKLSRQEIEKVANDSGLYGFTATDEYLEAYYVGDPSDAGAIEGFEQSITKAQESLGGNGRKVDKEIQRLWPYGHGENTVPYDRIRGDVSAKQAETSVTARRIASRVRGHEVQPYDPAPKLTDEQLALQTRIMQAYEAMPMNDLSNPQVRRAYEELATELVNQYSMLPVRVEILSGQGEPYKNSAEMRRDVIDNNHLFIYGTDKDTFGPEGVTYDNHPLLNQSEFKDITGKPLLMNDLLRAVHDYYAHTMTKAEFGEIGEEAAWQNHMSMTVSPWARWALTSETRGQNSWVNFRPEARKLPLKERGFAVRKVGLLPIEFTYIGDADKDTEMRGISDEGLPGQRSLYQGSFNPPLFSKLIKTVEEKMPAQAPADQVRGLIKDIKDEEKKWLRVEEFLKEQKGKIDKATLLEYLRAHEPKIKVVVKGAAKAGEIPVYTSVVEEDDGWHVYDTRFDGGDVSENIGGPWATRQEAIEAIQDTDATDEGDTRFSEHTLPGGENYREVLFTLPVSYNQYEAFRNKMEAKYLTTNFTGKMTNDEYAEYEKVIASSSNIPTKVFFSGHFDEPNILAHTRLNDRIDADGKRVLFVEEIQSDWHQKGRKEGYRGDARKIFSITFDGNKINGIFEEQQAKNIIEDHLKEFPDVKWSMDRLPDEPAVEGVPDAPFRKTWHEFAFKQIIRMAAEGGYDSIAWTTGEQQAERYDLSKQVDSIGYRKDGDNTYEISAIKNGESALTQHGQTIEQVEGLVGKEVAKKISEGEGKERKGGGGVKDLSGLDLKVGGEGMKGFYDKILVDFVNKFGKKYGVRVGESEIPKEIAISTPTDDDFDMLRSRGELVSVHSIPMTDQLRDAAMGEGFSLFQKGRKDTPKGATTFGPSRKFNIYSFEGADLSTMLHESGHFFLEVMRDLNADPNAPESARKDWQATLEYLKNDGTSPFTTEQHENFARSFEAYLMEGKAPSAELKNIFSTFRAWLVAIYKSAVNLGVELTPEIRGVFDRMIATEEQIAAAQADLPSLFGDLQALGVNEETARRYAEAVAEAQTEAEDELLDKAMEAQRRQRRKDWREERDKLENTIRVEVNQRPEIIALSVLKNGKLPDGTDLPEDSPLRGVKLLAASVEDFNLPLPDGITATENGIDPEHAAEIFGFTSGEQLLTLLSENRNPEREITRRAAEAMRERYPDTAVDGSLPREAVNAIHTEKRSRKLRLELELLASKDMATLKGLTRRLAMPLPQIEEVRQEAEASVAKMRVRDIKPDLYHQAERRLSRQAVSAFVAGDLNEAFRLKHKELVNHELYMAAQKAIKAAQKIVDYANRFSKPAVRERLAKAGGTYLDQIDAILDRFDFRKSVALATLEKRKSLREWVEEQRELGFDPVIPEKLLEEAYRQHYKDTPYEELQGIRDSLANIAHLANVKGRLLKAAKGRELQVAIDEATASIEANSKGAKPVNLETRLPQEQASRVGAGFLADHRKLANIAREMDGYQDNGVMWNLIVRPLNDAGNAEATANAKASTKLKELFDLLKGQKLYKKEYIPEINGSLSKMGQLTVALNWGNEDNRTKLLEGQGWETRQVEAILDRLTEADWKFVEGVWEYVNSFWPETAALSKRVNGVAPDKVEASPFRTKFGWAKGGYFPLKYDDRREPRAYANLAKEAADMAMHGAAVRSTTRHGHREARVTGVKMPIRLDFGVIFEHISQVVHDQTHYETLIDLNRILGNREMQSVIYAHYGDQIYGQMRDALNDVAAGNVPAETSFEQGINWIRAGASIAAMGWSVTTALVQPSGMTQSMVRIGPKWIAVGMKRWMGDAARMENSAKLISEKSEFMANRSRTQMREINEIRNKVGLSGGPFSAAEDSFFWFIAKMQQVVDIPTWLGAYEKAYAENAGIEDANAIALADQAVIDSQGSGQIKDLSKIQRGGPIMKLWTNFYSFFNVTYNQVSESVGKTDFRKPGDVGRFAVDMLMLLTIPVLFSVALKMAIQGGDDEDEVWEKLAREQANYILGMMVGIREMGSIVQGFSGYEGPAGTRFYSDFSKLAKQIEQGEADEALWRALNKTAGILLHYPATQIDRSTRGFIALMEGETANPMALLFGPPKK